MTAARTQPPQQSPARPVAKAPPPPRQHARPPPPSPSPSPSPPPPPSPRPPPPRHQHLPPPFHHAPPQPRHQGGPSSSTSVLGVDVPHVGWLSQRTPVLGLRGGVLAAVAAVIALLCICACLCRRCRRRTPRLAPCPHRRPLKHRVHAHHQATTTPTGGKDGDDVEAARWRPPTFDPPIEAIKAEQKAPLMLARGPAGTSGETEASESAAGGGEAGPPEAARRGWGRRFSRREIEEATCGLAPGNVIGEGGCGVVYRGVLRDNTAVAIKNLHNNRGQAEKDFRMEVATISRVRHKNLVSLLGYCSEGDCRMLVYQYMDNSNLDKWLHHDDSESAH
ncbi:hypothetical protein PR202_gb07304 [Eleusine coracana subsp. coracana]|uniref:Protein kinase domain-containing protein n=1 Tax=Eleusine coracana subsp. coracana TaxID=191504 RepID=A0AAV5EB63_ELECO|nr:hypothetical protein PR202_gb07304 [Eleusine coracana subsp. coracana]